MDRMELVDRLRDKTNVSYEEAKNALENSDWDILDAIIYLEKQGKANQETGSYSTKKSRQEHSRGSGYSQYYEMHKNTTTLGDVFRKIWKQLGKIVKWGNRNSISAFRYGERILSIPITLFVILFFLSFSTVVFVMLVSLFFGVSYSLSGPDLGREDINDVIGKATKVADSIKEEFTQNGKKANKDQTIYEQDTGEDAGENNDKNTEKDTE